MRTIKEVAQDVKRVSDIHGEAYKNKWEFIWKACNNQLELLQEEACMALINKDKTYFWSIFPKGNSDILKYLEDDKDTPPLE